MENLQIKKTKYTVGVQFDMDKGILEMNGASYPENAFEFFDPLIKWVREFISETKNPIVLNIKVNYLNTSSSKCIYDLLEILGKFKRDGGNLQINWHYESDDDDIMEAGKEFADDAELVFNLISY